MSSRFAPSVAAALLLVVLIPATLPIGSSDRDPASTGVPALADNAPLPSATAADAGLPFLDDDAHSGMDAPDACVPGAPSPILLEPDVPADAMVLLFVDSRDVFAFRPVGLSTLTVQLRDGPVFPDTGIGIPTGPVFFRLDVLGQYCEGLTTSTTPGFFGTTQSVSVGGQPWVNIQVSVHQGMPGGPTPLSGILDPDAGSSASTAAGTRCHPPCTAVGFEVKAG